jgi:hypothetical protein
MRKRANFALFLDLFQYAIQTYHPHILHYTDIANAGWSDGMRTLTVYTDAYFEKLDELTAGFPRRVKRPELHYIKLYYETFDADVFYRLLDWVAFQENPALRGIPKLAELARAAIPASASAQNIVRLQKYIEKNHTLHLEGYVRFRMADYNNYLNRVLYAIVKRINL